MSPYEPGDIPFEPEGIATSGCAFRNVCKGDLACARAAELLDLTPRHIKRLKARYRQGSAAALAHASRGRPSHRRLPEPTRARILRPGAHALRRLQRSPSLRKARRAGRPLPQSRDPPPPAPPRKASARPANAAPPLIASAVCVRPREGELVQLDGSPSRLARRSRPHAHRSRHAGRRHRQNPCR